MLLSPAGKDFVEQKLILTDEKDGAVPFQRRIEAGDLFKFVEANREHHIDKLTEPDFRSPLNVAAILGLSGVKGVHLHNFDDNDNDTEMVYGIVVNGYVQYKIILLKVSEAERCPGVTYSNN
jgi:hypothetical protein